METRRPYPGPERPRSPNDNSPKLRDRLRLKQVSMWGSLSLLLMVLSSDEMPKTPEIPSEKSQPSTPKHRFTEAERRALFTLQCRVVDNAQKKVDGFIIHRPEGRRYHLQNFAKLLSCADFRADFDPSIVCIAVKKELDRHPIRGYKNSVMFEFFQNLYLEMRCSEIEQPDSNVPIAVKELFQKLKVIIEQDPPKMLDPKTSITQLCQPAFELATKHSADIKVLSAFVLAHRKELPKISVRIEAWRKNNQIKNKRKEESTDQDLQKVVENNLEWITISAAAAPFLCSFPSEQTLLKKMGKDMTAQKFSQYRTEMFPFLKELVEYIAKDPDKNEPAFTALKNIAQSIADIK